MEEMHILTDLLASLWQMSGGGEWLHGEAYNT